MIVDAGLSALSFYLAHLLRWYWHFEVFGGTAEIFPFHEYVWLLALILPGAPLILRRNGFYLRPLFASRGQTARILFNSCATFVISLVLLVWVMREVTIARSVLIFFGVISFVVIFLKEELLRRWRRSALGQSQAARRLVLVGTPEETRPFLKLAGQSDDEDFEVVARINLNDTPVERLVEVMHEHSPNGVLLAAKHTYFGQIEQAIALCEREGVEVWLVADFFKTQISKTSVATFLGRPMLVFQSAPTSAWPLVAKHAVDFFGSLALLLAVSPVMLLTALAIKLTSPGPILFRQQRSGLNGRPFTMLKFRSMRTDAEQLRHELEALNEMSGPVFKITNDPRITPLGRFLRKWSIDELPQLINVLRGDMSLVGPRPLPVHEVKRFDDPSHRRRLSVKPGLTCLWQVSGRNQVKDFTEWVRLDLEYIDNWSLWLDFKILLMTVPAVLTGAGAK